MRAYCFRSGRIEIQRDDRKVPEGAIVLGRHRSIRRILCPLVRWAYDNKTALVPGVPEADSDGEAFAALMKFSRLVADRIKRA